MSCFVTFRAAKGGDLFQRLALVMWVLWNAFLTNVVRPLRGFVGASLGGGKGSTTITLQNGTRVRYGSTPIAEGGFSFVFVAKNASTRERYALKKILCQVDEQRELALAEMRSHREFSHPNLMPLLDCAFVGVSQGEAAFMLFPFMEGSLRNLIDQRVLGGGPPLGEVEALVIFAGVCRGVKALHGHRPAWAHRHGHGTPVLMDFGSVAPAERRVKGRTDALAVQDEASQHCTMPFRAPELFDVGSDAVLDQRTDVWSLGCLLYAMRFGYSPFECEFAGAGGSGRGGGGVGDVAGVRVVECSFLRVIGTVVFPSSMGQGGFGCYSEGFRDLVIFTLQQDPSQRPFVEEVLQRTVALSGVE
ncbi:unnamed protein product, partial [Sphacelaria rigidula]